MSKKGRGISTKLVLGLMGATLFLIFGWDINSYLSNGLKWTWFYIFVLYPVLFFYIAGGFYLILQASGGKKR